MVETEGDAIESTPGYLAKLLPVVLSGLRLLLAALFPLLRGPAQIVVVLLAGASDAADGFVARRLGVASWQGGILDGVCDKVFTVTVLITVTAAGQLAIWQAALLMTRDFIVVGLYLYLFAAQRWNQVTQLTARWYGKATTVLLFIFFLVLLSDAGSSVLLNGLFIATASLSLLAGLDYIASGLRPSDDSDLRS